MYALADIDNCYPSVELIFKPKYRNRPVVVASNNDGAVVGRNAIAKQLGIKMGEPIFKLQHLVHREGLVIFSSNYALYADVTSRVMSILEDSAPSGFSRYSVDECWLGLDGMESNMDLVEFGLGIRQKVLQWTGLTICVGIAQTFTLAKLANRGAKKYPATGGVVDLRCIERQRRLMKITDIEDVWGVGRRLSARMRLMGIETALDLAKSDPKEMRKEFSVNVERTIRELQGTPCFSIEESPPAKQQIICSRSFGSKVKFLKEMEQAIADYTVTAAQRLRGEKQTCRVVTVFIRTNSFNQDEPYYNNSATGSFSVPTSDTRDLLRIARQLLKHIWRDGFRYAKAGVMLSDFYSPGVFQQNLFEQDESLHADTALMATLDAINQKGLGKVFFAGQGVQQDWAMRRKFLSPSYTTNWNDLPIVR